MITEYIMPRHRNSSEQTPEGENTPVSTPMPRVEELHALVERYRAILAAVPDIIMETDMKKVYTWANQAGQVFFGEDVIGHEASDYFVGEQDTYEIVAPLFRGSEDTIYVESWQRRHDGEKRLLAWWCRTLKNEAGRVVGNLATARDITENRQAEQSLRESEAFLTTIFQNGPYAAWISDENGTLLRINKACCDVLNITEEDVVGKYNVFQDNLVQEQGCMDLVRQVYEEGKAVRFELDYDTARLKSLNIPKSTHRILDITISPIQNETGKVTHAIIQQVDITDRRETEEKIRELNAGLERRVRERTEELRRAVHLMAGREIRMAELKDVIRVLRGQLIQAGINPMADDPLAETAPTEEGKP